MPATLTIVVSDEVLEHLRQQSAGAGKTPESLAAEYLAGMLRKSRTDPLMRWAGAFESAVPDAAERHDHYLGEALNEELHVGSGT